jgi:hypothetical protein
MYSVKMSRVIDQCCHRCQTKESKGSDQDSHVHQPVILLDVVRCEQRSARRLQRIIGAPIPAELLGERAELKATPRPFT